MTNIPSVSNPVLLDRALFALQTHLASKLPWLTSVYGRSQKLVELRDGRAQILVDIQDGKEFYYPAVFLASKGEYESMFPDDVKKAFSFFIVHDPQKVAHYNTGADITADVSLIIWYDIRQVYPGTTEYNTESVKSTILNCLTNSFHSRGIALKIENIVESPENVYREYSFSQIGSQYSMHPFSCLRINMTLNFVDVCL